MRFTVDALRSSVRPLVTFMLVGGFVYGFVAGVISGENYGLVVATIIGFWFGSRQK